MRSKRSSTLSSHANMRGTNSKIHIMTGGLKENVSQLEMQGGNLIDCLNYQEVDGAYHGYLSLSGYEPSDGTGLASDVDVTYLVDYGNDNSCYALLETTNDFTDNSQQLGTVVNNGVSKNTDYYKFYEESFLFNGISSMSIIDNTGINLEGEDFALDLWVRLSQTTVEYVLMEKENSYKISIANSRLRFEASNDGASYTHLLESNAILLANTYYHLAVCRKDDTIFLFIAGDKGSMELSFTGDIFTNTNNLVIGDGVIGRMDEIRVSKGTYRWINSFDVPSLAYGYSYYSTTQIDDVAREAFRDTITALPGDGNVLGVSIYDTEVYGVRDSIAGTEASLHVESASGWSALTPTINPGGIYRFETMRFSELAGLQREPVLFFVSGVDDPMYTTGSTIVSITHANLPTGADGIWCSNLVQFKNRLFLAYPNGRLIFSSVNDPTDFDVLTGAGEFYLEDEITDMVVAPGDTLIVFCRNSTHLIKSLADVSGTSSDTISSYKFSQESYSRRSGAYSRTAQRMLGDIYFLDDRGVTNLEASDTFGDFSSNAISKNVQKTLLASKSLTSCSTIQRESNQYRLFFTDNTGLIFTFDVEKNIKGITKIKYDLPVLCVDEGEDEEGNLLMVFGSSDGYVYRMDSGTSFNGEVISTSLKTPYYSYSTSTKRKHFRKVTLEAQAAKGLEFFGKPDFDYQKATTPSGDEQSLVSDGYGGIWGIDRWSLFSWGSSSVQDPVLYFTGFGKNLSIQIQAEDKYREAHVINSMTVEYSSGTRVQ